MTPDALVLLVAAEKTNMENVVEVVEGVTTPLGHDRLWVALEDGEVSTSNFMAISRFIAQNPVVITMTPKVSRMPAVFAFFLAWSNYRHEYGELAHKAVASSLSMMPTYKPALWLVDLIHKGVGQESVPKLTLGENGRVDYQAMQVGPEEFEVNRAWY